jgi:hypothetical protein
VAAFDKRHTITLLIRDHLTSVGECFHTPDARGSSFTNLNGASTTLTVRLLSGWLIAELKRKLGWPESEPPSDESKPN